MGASVAGGTLLIGNSGIITPRSSRRVYRILNADRTKVGTLPILRAFAGDHLDYVSPYVLFDEFGPVDLRPGATPLRVNAHPHAGIIPTTYFLSGSGHHRDSLNYDFQVSQGEFMMFSSGRGAIHMEETGKALFDDGGKYHGFQIWLNMPAQYKFIDPSTWVFKHELGKIEKSSYTANIVLGELFGVRSRIELLTPAFYYHIIMKPGCRLDIPVEATQNAFVYAIDGTLELADHKMLKENQIALYERGDHLINLFTAEGAELLVLGGAPLNEPVYSYGPFVMNTEEQIRQCIADYRSGKMGDTDVVNQF